MTIDIWFLNLWSSSLKMMTVRIVEFDEDNVTELEEVDNIDDDS